MTEAKAKFLKGCDKDSLKKIRSVLSGGQSAAVGTGRDIVDGICRFVKKDTNTSYAAVGDSIFATPESFSKAIKDCMPTDMDRNWLQNVASSVNQNTDGQKGSLLNSVSNPSTATEMVPFFPYFKILFKLAQLGMTITKQTSLERQVEKHTKALEDVTVDMEKQQAIVKNLEFYSVVEAEVQKAHNNEIEPLRIKSDELDRKIKSYSTQFEDRNACMQNYFSDLQ